MFTKLKQFATSRQKAVAAAAVILSILFLVRTIYRQQQRIDRLESDVYDAQQKDDELEGRINELDDSLQTLQKDVRHVKSEIEFLPR